MKTYFGSPIGILLVAMLCVRDADGGTDDVEARETGTVDWGEYIVDGVETILPLDDFDDGDIVNEVGGTWMTFDDHDNTEESVVWPKSFLEGGVFEASGPGYGGSEYAARIIGTTGKARICDCVALMTTLFPKSDCPRVVRTDIDMTAWDGIQFMAKGTFRLGEMIVMLPYARVGNPEDCPDNDDSGETLTDYADYQFDFIEQLAGEWKLFRIRFNQLYQPLEPEWGIQAELEPVLEDATALIWQYSRSPGEVDFWLDNIALFKDLSD
jgi:hypothetical protein